MLYSGTHMAISGCQRVNTIELQRNQRWTYVNVVQVGDVVNEVYRVAKLVLNKTCDARHRSLSAVFTLRRLSVAEQLQRRVFTNLVLRGNVS